MQLTFDLFQDVFQVPITDTKDLLPEEMSLHTFLSAHTWKAILDEKASGESKGQYLLIEPDGKPYRGGWIGKHKNEEQAKRSFHKNRVFMSVWWGNMLPEHVLADYPDILSAQRNILAMQENIIVKEGPYVRVNIDQTDKFFNKADLPLFDRVSMREFVRMHGLLSKDVPINKTFSQIEQMANAIEMKMKQVMDENHYPDYGEYESLLLKKDVCVLVRFPVSVDDAGYATTFEIVEGRTIYNASSPFRPGCIIEGTEQRMTLYPSQIIGIKQGQNWEEVELV